MKIARQLIMLALVAASLSASAAAQSSPSTRRLAADAAAALEAGDHARAADLYRQLREVLPDSAAVPYNLGVAEYRRGDYEQAAAAFNEALDRAATPDLRARSLFNLGDAAYAQALQAQQGQGDVQAAGQALEGATGKLEEAMGWFRRAIAADPADQDARRNGELAWRLLEQLRQMQQQMPQQSQDQQQQQNQDQQQQPDQQSQSQQDKQEQQDQSQQNQSQPDQSQPDQSQQPQPQPEAGDEQQQQQQPSAQGEQQQQQQQGEEARPMSEDEARRLLQRVRDKERQRRAELARRQAARQPPVEKDW